MIGTIARLALLRFMPRRLVPLLTAWEVFRLVRGRSQNRGTPVDTSGTGRRSRFGRR
jgi:hypothetical protein